MILSTMGPFAFTGLKCVMLAKDRSTHMNISHWMGLSDVGRYKFILKVAHPNGLNKPDEQLVDHQHDIYIDR